MPRPPETPTCTPEISQRSPFDGRGGPGPGGGEAPNGVQAPGAEVVTVGVETRTRRTSEGFPFEELAALQDALRKDLDARLAQQDARVRALFSRYAKAVEELRAEEAPNGLGCLRAAPELTEKEEERGCRAQSPPGMQSADASEDKPPRKTSKQKGASGPPDPAESQPAEHGGHDHELDHHHHSFLSTWQGSVGHKYVAEESEIKVKTTAVERALAAWFRPLDEPEHAGCLATVVNSNAFGMASTLLVLATCFTSILVANYKMEYLEEESPALRTTATTLSALFIVEIALKLAVHRAYFFMADERAWNIFDFLLALTEVWGIIQLMIDSGKTIGLSFLRSLRILKITRVLRMVRVISAFKELRLLLNALTGSIMTVVWCGLVILFTLIMCSMVFVQIATDYLMSQPEDVCDEEGWCLHAQLQKNFGSVQGAALSLFMSTTGGNDWSYYYHIFEGVGWTASSAFVVFTFCFQFGMFNLLTSMFVDKAIKESKPDVDMLIVQQRTTEVEQCKELREQLLRFDKDGGGTISLEEFEEMILDEAMASFLASAGLDIHDAAMFFQMMTEISGEDLVSTDQFVQGCMRLKGLATSIDMQAMRYELKLIAERLTGLETPPLT